MAAVERKNLAAPIEDARDVGRVLVAIEEISKETNRPALHPFFALLAYSGLPRGEALGLRWSDVDLERRMITVRGSFPSPGKPAAVLQFGATQQQGTALSQPQLIAKCSNSLGKRPF
jgi:integrase